MKSTCSKDEEAIYFGEWDGIVDGCMCNRETTKGLCTSKSQRRCTNITSIKPKKYKFYNDNSICIKRSKLKYMDLLNNKQILEKDNQCPEGYEYCGIIDTKERILCLKSKSECPITLEYIKNKYPDYYKSLNLENKSGENNETILSIFKVNEDQPCMNPDEKVWNYHYILEPEDKNCKTKINDELFDYNYEPLLKPISKYQLYQDNFIYTRDVAPDELKSERIYLYGKGFLGLNPEDVGDYSYDKFLSIQKVSNNCNSVMKFFSYVLFGFVGFSFFVCFGMCCTKRHSSSNDGCFLMCGLIGIGISAIITFLVYFILSIIIFVCSIRFKSLFNVQGNDPYINELFKILNVEQNLKNFIFSLCIMIGSSLALILGIIIIICHYFEGNSGYHGI